MDKRIIYSVSGGKDSSAMLCRAAELGLEIDEVIFSDTRLEFPEIYNYLDVLEKHTGYKITRLEPIRDWEEWFYGVPKRGAHSERGQIRGFPLENLPGCYIKRDSKIVPLERYIGIDNIIHIGYTKDEVKRSMSSAYVDKKNEYRFPLIEWGWSDEDCIKYLDKIGIPHPMAGIFNRTGCWLCPRQTVDSLITLYKRYPDLWAKLKKYDNDAPRRLKGRVSLEEIELMADGKIKIRR